MWRLVGSVAVQTDGVHPYDADGEPTPIHRGLAAFAIAGTNTGHHWHLEPAHSTGVDEGVQTD